MAKGAIIGALRVVLGAETAAFETAMSKAQSRLASFSSGMAKAAAGVAAAMVGLGTAAAVAVRGIAKEADKLTKLGRAIGVPVEQLSALKHAAESSGMSIDSLGSSMGRFARNLADAASNAESTAGRAFAAIGVSVQNADGTLRSSMDVMRDIADRFKGMEDGAGKTALAMQLFGRTGADMINMLNAGSAGINAMMQEAEQLGIVIDQKTGEAAERFNGALDKMATVKTGLLTQITARLAPTFAYLAEQIVESTKTSTTLKYAIEALVVSLKSVLTAGTAIVAVFREAGRALGTLAAAVAEFATGNFARAVEIIKAQWTNAKDAIAGDIQFVKDLWNEAAGEMAAISTQFPQRVAAPVIQPTKAAADEMRAFHEHARNALYELINSPTETFTAKMAAIEEAVRSGTITFQQFGQLTKRIQQEQIDQWHDLASGVASALTTIFGKSKAAAIASAVINTAQAVTKNLSAYPWPFSAAMAALAAASGAAQIAAIKSTNLGGSGRTPSVGGGSGGGGGAASSAGGAPQPTQMLQVQGINPTQLFSGEAMRGLAEKLLEYQRDGGEVVFV